MTEENTKRMIEEERENESIQRKDGIFAEIQQRSNAWVDTNAHLHQRIHECRWSPFWNGIHSCIGLSKTGCGGDGIVGWLARSGTNLSKIHLETILHSN